MDTGVLGEAFERLMGDARLMKLCELQRTGDEVLDVISLSENQHSDILAWLLDAKEGHGQGDEILRDLLISASARAASNDSGLDGRYSTAKFFAEWPPSRIRTTSFGTAFTARELGMSKEDRVDLFVIDAQNRFVLLIENKSRASHKSDQLERYRSKFRAAMNANPRLRDFTDVYIALDREFDEEASEPRPAEGTWLHLGYNWLETSATRAEMHVQRGNSAARLVVSYCNRQTDWTSEEDEEGTRLAAELCQEYPDAVSHLIAFSRGRIERNWLTKQALPDSTLLFLLQNKGVVETLKETQGMASVKAAIHSCMPALGAESVVHKRVWLQICPAGWENYGNRNGWVTALHVRYGDVARTNYTVEIRWTAANAESDAQGEHLRKILTIVEPKFGKHFDSRWRRVVVGRGLSLTELLKKLEQLNTQLNQALPDEWLRGRNT